MSDSLKIPNLAGVITKADAIKQGLTRYYTGKPCKHGHISERQVANRQCCECLRIANLTDQHKNMVRLSQRKRRQDPALREKERQESRRRMREIYYPHYRADPAMRERAAKMRRDRYYLLKLEQPEKVKAKRRQDYLRSASTPQGVVKARLRARMHTALRAAKCGKASKSLQLLGCTWHELVSHLESRFTGGMSWDNIGAWHIDHIRPCASFDLTDPAQQIQCFHYTNLQPLWAEDNIRKGATHE